MIKLTIEISPLIENTTFSQGVVLDVTSFNLDKTDFVIKNITQSLDYLYYYSKQHRKERDKFLKDKRKLINKIIGLLSLGVVNIRLLGASQYSQSLNLETFTVTFNWVT